jgi:hypothetical protein
MAHLEFDREITALFVIDSGNHLVCGGAVQAERRGGTPAPRVQRGRRRGMLGRAGPAGWRKKGFQLPLRCLKVL